MVGGASLLSAASSGDNSVSTALSSGFAAASAGPSGFTPDFASAGLAPGLARTSFLSLLSEDLPSDFSTAGSRNATRSWSPSMTTMASGFSAARMPLAAAAQSAGSPLG